MADKQRACIGILSLRDRILELPDQAEADQRACMPTTLSGRSSFSETRNELLPVRRLSLPDGIC